MVELELPMGIRQEWENKHVGTWLESACTIRGLWYMGLEKERPLLAQRGLLRSHPCGPVKAAFGL